MLGACAHVSNPTPPPVEQPKVVTRTLAVAVCPAEVSGDVPAQPAVPGDAVIAGNAAGQGWLSDIIAWGQALHDRLVNAKAACDKGADHG